MYLLKLSLRPWRVAPFSQVFSGMAVGFLLLLVGFLYWMQNGLKPVIHRLQREQVVTAYLDPAIEAKDESVIVDSIHAAVGAQASTEVRLVAPKDFIGNLKSNYPDLARELEELGGEADKIVPKYVSVSGLLDDQAQEKIRSVKGVESAESSKDRYRHIVGAFSVLRWIGRLLAVGICLALLTGLIHLAKMNHYLHQDALSLLKLWGAGGWALNGPGMLSGFSVGALGGIIAFVGWIGMGSWFANHLRALSPLLKEMPVASSQLGVVLLLAGSVLGLLAGACGSLTAAAARSHR